MDTIFSFLSVDTHFMASVIKTPFNLRFPSKLYPIRKREPWGKIIFLSFFNLYELFNQMTTFKYILFENCSTFVMLRVFFRCKIFRMISINLIVCSATVTSHLFYKNPSRGAVGLSKVHSTNLASSLFSDRAIVWFVTVHKSNQIIHSRDFPAFYLIRFERKRNR